MQQVARAWVVTGCQVGEVVRHGDQHWFQDHRGTWWPVHVGQTPGIGAALGITALLAGVALVALAAESLPGALIAHYGFNVTWGKSALIGVASAIGFNMIAGALSPPAPAPTSTTPRFPTDPLPLPAAT